MQSNNGGEFSNIAHNSKIIYFTEEEILQIIKHVYQLWLGAKQITSTPRHKESNRGIECYNSTIEGKMNTWILEMNSNG